MIFLTIKDAALAAWWSLIGETHLACFSFLLETIEIFDSQKTFLRCITSACWINNHTTFLTLDCRMEIAIFLAINTNNGGASI